MMLMGCYGDNCVAIYVLAAIYCKKLHCLNLAGLPLSSIGLRMLSTIASNLRILNLDACSGANDTNLQHLFQHCLKLESLTLSHICNLTGNCLTALAHAPLKELVMDGCENLQSESLVGGICVHKNLLTLNLSLCTNLKSNDVQKIMDAVPWLRSLSMEHFFPLFTSTTLIALGQLHDLTSLHLFKLL